MTRVRAAVPTDAHEVARVHVRSWQSAYRGLIAHEFLDGLTPEADLPLRQVRYRHAPV